MSNQSQYGGSQLDTSQLPSPFWSDCRWGDADAGYIRMVRDRQDFTSGGKITSPTTEAALVGLPLNGYCSDALAESGNKFDGTYAITAGIAYDFVKNGGGGLQIANTTDNNGVAIRSLAAQYQISATKGTFWFETRLKLNSTATNVMSLFAGMMDANALTTSLPLVAAGGAIGDLNCVGIHKPEANTTTYNSSYKTDGVTAVVVNTGVGTTAAGTALADATYIKFGMKFEPRRANTLTFYTNGVKHATTKSIPANTGTDFPADQALGWVIALGCAGPDAIVTIDWVQVAQEIV